MQYQYISKENKIKKSSHIKSILELLSFHMRMQRNLSSNKSKELKEN
jgi:hypothetical protein